MPRESTRWKLLGPTYDEQTKNCVQTSSKFGPSFVKNGEWNTPAYNDVCWKEISKQLSGKTEDPKSDEKWIYTQVYCDRRHIAKQLKEQLQVSFSPCLTYFSCSIRITHCES